MSSKPVLISGAGIASLLLAQSLKRSNIPFIIFERDTSFVFRAQGYRLRLSAIGLDAIESVLSPVDWQTFYDTCGKTSGAGVQAFDAISGEALEVPVANKEALSSRGGKVFGIARGDMRRLFAAGCEDYIQWGRQVTGYELTGDGVRAIFSDGSKSVEGSLLVGGEGIYSAVARQLSGGKLKVFDTGARGIHGQAPTRAFRGLDEGVFRLVDESRGPGKHVFLITNVRAGDKDDENVVFGWTMGGNPGVITVPGEDYTIIGERAATIAQSLTKNWHPRFKPLFDEMDVKNTAFWKITCSTPTGIPDWQNEPRVTLIGDAVHSMTPAGGNGANTAVRDSALLGRLLREAGGYKEGLTAAYEKEMRAYGSDAVRESYGSATKQFGVNIDVETSSTV